MRACDVSVPASRPFSSRRTAGGVIPRNAVHWLVAAVTSGATGGVFDMLFGLKIGGNARGGRSSGDGAPAAGAIGDLVRIVFFSCCPAGFFFDAGLAGAGPATSPVGSQRMDTPRGSGNLKAGKRGVGAGTRSGVSEADPHPMR